MTSQKKKISDSDAGEPGKPNRKGDIWGRTMSILGTCTGENRKRQMQSGETGWSQWVLWSTSYPMVSEKERSWGGIQPMLFLFLHIGTYCIYAIFLQVKKPYLRSKLLLLMEKVIGLFQSKKDSVFLSLALPYNSPFSCSSSLPTEAKSFLQSLLCRRLNGEKVIQTAYHKLTIPSVSIDWRDLHYELSQGKKTMVNSSKNKEIDHLNKEKALTPLCIHFFSVEIYPGGTNIN